MTTRLFVFLNFKRMTHWIHYQLTEATIRTVSEPPEYPHQYSLVHTCAHGTAHRMVDSNFRKRDYIPLKTAIVCRKIWWEPESNFVTQRAGIPKFIKIKPNTPNTCFRLSNKVSIV